MLACAAALVAAPAWGGRIAVHPPVVPAQDPLGDAVVATFALETGRLEADLVGSIEVAGALGPSVCARGDAACLAKLANATGAAFAVRVELEQSAPELVMNALVVRADGAVVRRIERLAFEAMADNPLVRARNALRAAFAALRLDQLDGASPLPAQAPPPAPPPPDPAPPIAAAPAPPAPKLPVPEPPAPATVAPQAVAAPAPAAGVSGLRVAGLVVGAAGLASVATGGVLALVANGEAQGLTVGRDGSIPLSQLPLRKSVDAKASAAAGLAIGGGVALAAGLVMVILGQDAPVAVAPVPLEGGAAVAVTGVLP